MSERPNVVKCRICDRPVSVAPRGSIPNAHVECRDLDNNIDRLVRSIEAVLKADPRRSRAVRALIMIKIWAWMNSVLSETVQRAGPRPPSVRLAQVIKGLERTRAGRAALDEWVRQYQQLQSKELPA